MEAKDIYDNQAKLWQRKKANVLTDFTVRPLIFNWCGNLTGKNIIDLGCGEGYVSRNCKSQGAESVLGVDISKGMIEKAKQQEQETPLGINYICGSITDFYIEENNFDIALGVFVFNYLTIDETKAVFKNIFKGLKDGGQFILALPHPLLPFIGKNQPPTYFDQGNFDYYSARDQKLEGKIWCLDGSVLEIQLLHKTFADIFDCITSAGFQNIQNVSELSIPAEVAELNPELFNIGVNIPRHLVLRIKK